MTTAVGQEPLLALKDLVKVYGEGESAVRALDGIDLAVHPGEFVAVMGASGSGKSTAMNILGFLDVATSGSYRFRGSEVTELDRDQRALLRRHFVGFVFQGFNLMARSSALENVELPLVYRREGRAARHQAAGEALELVGLSDRAHHAPSELSGGQQQRVAIARALVTKPSLLLADEPTGNLDTKRGTEIMELLVDLNRRQGLTIVMVTHDPHIARFASRIVEFQDGRIVADHEVARGAACSG
jgi:ABC-type lipoprotein export system ATPase subunit